MSDTQTDNAIRMLLKEQEAELQPPKGDRKNRTAKVTTEKKHRVAAKPIFQPLMRRFWAFARAHPPTRKQILIGASVLLILLRPWLVFWVILLALVLLVIVYFSLGPDACAEKTVKSYQWIAGRWPETAEKLRRSASTLFKRIGVLLDKLPERWTEGIYLSDFDVSETQAMSDDQPDPFDRLTEQAR
jgi:hypothetical protein